MVIFEVGSKHVARSVGAKTLHHIPDLNSAERFKVLCLVIQRTSFWFWKKPKLYPTQAKLQDLLSQKLKLDDADTTFTLLKNFKENPSLNLKGDMAAKLAEELNIELSASDDVNIHIDFGDLQKNEIEWEKLYKLLQDVSIDWTHPLMKQVEKDSRASLCVVLESVATSKTAYLSDDNDKKFDADAKVGVPNAATAAVKVDVHTKGSVEIRNTHSYDLPPETVLAYSCTKLSMHEDGTLKLHPTVENMDFLNEPFIEKREGSHNKIDLVKTQYKNFVKSAKFPAIESSIKSLLGCATNEVLEAVTMLLNSVEMSFVDGSLPKHSYVSTIKTAMGGNVEGWKEFFEQLGFSVPENFDAGDAKLVYPTTDPEKLVHSCIAWIDALRDIAYTPRKLLESMSIDDLKLLFKIVEGELEGHKNRTEGVPLGEPVKQFLTDVGFIAMTADDKELFCYPLDNPHKLFDLFAALYILSLGL